MGEPSLKEKTARGLFFGGLSSFLQQLLNAAFGIYLARTLSQADYGLVGMLAIFTLLATVMQECGFPSALINRKEIKHDDYNAVFWFSLLVSLACYAILFCGAPLIARYFHQPVLTRLARVTFLSFILVALGTAHRTYLSKKLMIREMAMVNITAVVISGTVGVILAYKGFAYWTLVIQALVLNALTTIGYWIFSRWRPTLHWDFTPIREMFSYGIRIWFTSMLAIVNSNFLSVFLGRKYTADQVGNYVQGNKWSQMGVSVLTGMVTSVAQPVLASVTEENQRQLRVFRKMVRFAAFISFPAMLGLAFIATEFIPAVLTEKWNESVPLLQILCVGAAFTPIIHVCSNLILSRGKSSSYMWSQIILFACILGLVYLLYPYGIKAIVAGITGINALWLLVWAWLAKREIGYSFGQLMSDLLPFLGISVACIAGAWLITRGIDHRVWLMVAKILVTAALYVFVMWITKSVTFRESVQFILRRNP